MQATRTLKDPIGISVVIPVFNEPDWLPITLDALSEALDRSPFASTEIIVVDDGSEHETRRALSEWQERTGRELKVIRQTNKGRFAARHRGVSEASHEAVLLLDSRVLLAPDSLAFVFNQLREHSRLVWNGYCMIATEDHFLPRFWSTIVFIVYREYLSKPCLASYDASTFDDFPKGTGHFLAPRKSLLKCMQEFDSRYSNSRDANDDTLMLRALSRMHTFYISPEFASIYHGRVSFRAFWRHAHNRGIYFFDGFSRPDNRYFPLLLLAFPTSCLLAIGLVRKPLAVFVGLLAAWGAMGSLAVKLGPSRKEGVAFGVLLVPFSLAFGAGLWRGLFLAIRSKLVG